MNDIRSFISQQRGCVRWSNINTALSRLRCPKKDEYSQILPCENNWTTDIVEPPIFACKFAQKEGYEHILALANEDGKLAIHNMNGTKQRFGCDAHRNAIFDLAWMFDQMKLVTVSGDHSACLQDVSESGIQPTQIFEGHTRSVKTVAFRYNDSSVFATGGRDGTILTWDARSNQSLIGKVDRCLYNTHRFNKSLSTSKPKRKKNIMCTAVSGADSVTGLVFQDEYSLISCGAGDGVIKVWDMRKTYSNYTHDPVPKFVLPHQGSTAKNGFSNLTLDRSCMKLYANCLDNNIYCYNVGTYNTTPYMKYSGHENSTFYIKSSLSPNGRYLVSGSSDHNAYIWDVASSTPLIKLVGHQAEVTCVAWCPSYEIAIITCSDDLKHKFWKVGDEETSDNWEVEGAGVAMRIKKKKRHPPRRGCKRRLNTIFKENKNESVKRFIESGEGNNIKIFKSMFGPKKLFSSIDQNSSECYKSAHVQEVPDIQDEKYESPCKRLKEDKENDNSSFNKDDDTDIPSKRVKLDCPHQSEVTKVTSPLALIDFDESSSKTTVISDLPNFVIDGRAPHLNVSPIKKVEKDWLSKIRDEKGSLPNVETVDCSPKNNTCTTPKSRHKFKGTNPSSPHSPLLKFFKITSSNTQPCSPKSPNLSSYPCHYSTNLV
ncbi:protein lethal(2)denticleless [Agrilus planipennis]|uniref:Protein lethal(2)denticleless n=1 Tax=Agrilus planipennis TaxID=224129 RepID=A0A1W4XGB8_AGRPL|nr:protein lethal(2)denticleless [Agrilus planipennis]